MPLARLEATVGGGISLPFSSEALLRFRCGLPIREWPVPWPPLGWLRQFLKGHPKNRILDGLSTDTVILRKLAPLAFTSRIPQASL
jgi:hypothetical protein